MSTRCQIEFYDSVPSGEYGEPAARIYQHSDGYPGGIIPQLKKLEKVLSKSLPMYGPRNDDHEWAAAEFVSQYRKPLGGNIYVTHQLHPDIAFVHFVPTITR